MVVMRNKFYTDMCLILNGYRDTAVSISRSKLDFCLWVWINGEVYKRRVDTQDELLARILYAAARLQQRETSTRRTIRYLRTLTAECAEVDGGIL